MSNLARGRPPRRGERSDPWIHAALSVFEREDEARAVARAFPGLGTYLAEIEIPDSDLSARDALAVTPVKYMPPADTRSSHHAIQGDPDRLLGYVRRCVHA